MVDPHGLGVIDNEDSVVSPERGKGILSTPSSGRCSHSSHGDGLRGRTGRLTVGLRRILLLQVAAALLLRRGTILLLLLGRWAWRCSVLSCRSGLWCSSGRLVRARAVAVIVTAAV